MKIDILTLFPKMFQGPFDESIVKRAQEKKLVDIKIHNLRDWTEDKHRVVDDRPFGGGVGMILKVDIIDRAVTSLKGKRKNTKVILTDAGGNKFTQKDAVRLSKSKNLILIAGHYEGVDHRVHEHIVDEILSFGDFVLTGGELPVMVLIDSVVRLIPGVLEKAEATAFESFSPPIFKHLRSTTFLEYPQYTRPEKFKGWNVPKVLLSGNHAEIQKWRESQSVEKTKKFRPDLLKR